MNVWLVKVGEPLPTDGTNVRLLRVGSLASTLTELGHSVLWWSSTFDHTHKTQRAHGDVTVEVRRGYRLRMMRSIGYEKNVSIRRVIDHVELGRRFARAMREESRPDVIFCALPTIELAMVAARYGRRMAVPVVLDVRDLWPDAFAQFAPLWARPLARLALWPLEAAVRSACVGAHAITGINDAFVDWGVRHAGRSRRGSDRVFPLGFSERPPSEEAQRTAVEHWRQLGVTEGDGTFNICFVGTMGRHVDLRSIIDAARSLRDERPSIRLFLCGRGDHLDSYRERARGCDNVIFTGWIGAAEIWTLMRLSAVGLAPYHNTPDFLVSVPNKAVEYLSAGLPIVSPLQGVLANLLRDEACGVTVPEHDAQSLATCLRGLRDDPDRLAAMSANALRVFEERFVSERINADLCAYLEETARNGVGSRLPL